MTTLYRARTMHTLAPSAEGDTLAVEHGNITSVGNWAELREQHPSASVIDLGGATLVPGLIDSHIHPIGGIELTRGADLRHCLTLDDVERSLRSDPDAWTGDWLLGWGLDPNVFAGAPTGQFLDRIAPGTPAIIQIFDAHSLVASSTAIERAGISGSETLGANSIVSVDPSGRPTGYLIEHAAMDLVRYLIPPTSLTDRVALLRRNLMNMARTGFTAGHALDMGGPDSLALLNAAAAEPGGLALDLTVSPIFAPEDGPDSFEKVVAAQVHSGQRWRVSGVKLFIDGTIDNGTAWLYQPDTCGDSTVSLWLDPAQYTETVTRLHAAGIPTRTHAIGDRGVEHVVRTLASLPTSGITHRIEHIETATDDVLDELAAAGIAASMQPTHCTRFVRPDGSDNWSVRLGPERAARGFRTRDIRDRGITLALGSDWPVAPSDAREIIAAAQLRRQPHSVGAIGLEQGLTALQSLEGFTTHAAASIGASSPALRVGAPGTFTAFEHDPLATSPEVFATTRVVMTAIAGEVIVDER
ncbi:MAG: amidohydrolase [Lacisediminihabitans sp.]